MISLSPFHLAKRFQEKKVTEKQRGIYLIVMTALGGFFGSAMLMNGAMNAPASSSFMTQAAVIISLIGALLPLLLFLWANAQGDNKETVARFVLLSFDAYVRYFLAFLIVAMIFGAVAAVIMGPQSLTYSESTIESSMVVNLILAVVMSWHMYTAGRIASGADKKSK